MRKKLFVYSAVLAVGIFLLNKIASFFYWYSAMPQFDMIMHTLGGVFVAIWCAAILFEFLKEQKPIIWIIVLSAMVLIVGFLWEVFEFSVQGIMHLETLANIPDSLSDMVFDLLGGVLGSAFVIIKIKSYNRAHAE
jgi:hypothetical protein